MKQCECGEYVSDDYVRVFYADTEHITKCPNCSATSEIRSQQQYIADSN